MSKVDFDITKPETRLENHEELTELRREIHLLTQSQTLKPWYLKYLPLIVLVLGFLGTGSAFYFNTLSLADDVVDLKGMIKESVTRTELSMRMALQDQKILSLGDVVKANEKKSNDQFGKIDSKLDRIQDILLEKK